MRIIAKTILILNISTISSADYYVSGTYGNDENNGTSLSTPFKTIQQAASVISYGDICYIRQGLYHEAILLKIIMVKTDFRLSLQIIMMKR